MRNKYSAKECFRNYRFHSIFWKNILLVFSVILLPFICVFLISTYTYDELQTNETRTYSKELLTRSSMDVDNLFKEAKDAAILIGSDENVRKFIFANDASNSELFDTVDIAKFLSVINLSQDAFDSAYVYATYQKSIITSAGLISYEQFSDKASIKQWDRNGGTYQIKYLPADEENQKPGRISFFFKPRFSLAEREGCVSLSFNTEMLNRKFDYGDNVRLLILQNGLTLYDSKGELAGAYIADIQNLLNAGDNCIADSKDLPQFDLKVVLHVDSQPLQRALGKMRFTTTLIILFSLLGSILVVFYISRKVFDPISEILLLLEENQEPREDIVIQAKDELSFIRNSVNSTISKTKNIEAELGQRIRLLKKAQAVALQAQINPHFMYNTIDTINWMAISKIGKENDVSKMLNILSQLLRYSLSNTDTFVTLEEEINYTQKYLTVQQIRCNYSFDVFWDVPEEVQKCKVIKMILQPVVENAIKYGIKPFDYNGVLRIFARRLDDSILIAVCDSGFGLTDEETEQINMTINRQIIKESDHIGLSNVNQRINLMFGPQYGVTVKSKIGEGTTVELRVPLSQ